MLPLNEYAQEKLAVRITQTHIPSSNIRCITEDTKGFLWIGTQDGLFRHDSRTYRQYNRNERNKNKTGGSDVRDIALAPQGIWITTTQGGIDLISETTAQTQAHFAQNRFPALGTHTITSILQIDSVLYAGTEKGLYAYDLRQNSVRKPLAGLRFGDLYVDKLARGKDFLIVFFRHAGCISISIKTGTVADSLIATGSNGSYPYRHFAIAPVSAHSWLVGTNGGIHKVGLSAEGKLLWQTDLFPYAGWLNSADVYAVACDSNKNVWLSTENNLIKIDPVAHKTYVIADAQQRDEDILNSVYEIYCAKDNNIWLGCQNGLFHLKNEPAALLAFSRSPKTFTRIAHAYYLFPQNDSIVLTTAENGLYRVNTHTGVITEIDVTQVYDFAFYDPYGRLLVSNKTGLKELRGHSLTPVENIYPEFRKYRHYTINNAVLINDTEIVMGTENNNGILIWNFVDHTVINITTGSPGLQLDNNIINSIFRVQDNVFCVLTESSLLQINYAAKEIRRIRLVNDRSGQEYGLFFDMCPLKDDYYLSSYGNGVLVLDTSFRLKKIISTNDGLSNNSVYKLLPWRDSLLFMTTNFGLSILNVNTGNIRCLYQSDGLHDDVFEETSGNTHGNVIYAGGRNGFTCIYPEYLQPNSSPPVLHIDRLSIQLPDGSRDTSNLEATRFSIPSNALQTNLFFSGINYSNPDRTTFVYKISGLHKDWIPLGTQQFVTLIGMAPGTYRLQIQAFNEDGIGSAIKELTLVFLPKWYQTWWFRTLAVLLVSGVAYSFYRMRIRQMKKEQQIRSKLASDLHDDLGSTMNSIKVYTNLALMDNRPDNYLPRIKESTQEAITGIRDMIWVLDDSKDTVEDLLLRIYTFAAPLCEANRMQFKQFVSDDARDLRLGQGEKRNLYMMLKEAVNNVIKYAGCTTIEVRITIHAGRLRITVQDDGKGFDTTDIAEGNGLKNMRRRAKEINYQLTIASAAGSGTTIQFQKV